MPRQPEAVASPRNPARPAGRSGLVLAAGLALWSVEGRAQEAEGDVIVTHAYSNFGEVKYGPDMEHLDYVNPDAPKGGEIAIWSQGTFDSFNLYAFQGVAAALATIGSEAILAGTADDPYGAYCFLCTTMEYPEDLSWVQFNLRDDVTFQDGTPMMAEDVEFSMNLFLEQGISEWRLVRSTWLESMEVIDDHTIRFNFTDAAPMRDRVTFAGGTPIFSEAWFEETGQRLDEPSEVPLLSTGQYVLDEFDYNRNVIYRSNPDYWGFEHPLNIGRGNFETIRVEYFADASAAFEGFKAGEYTFRAENTSLLWATGYDFPALDKGWVVKETLPDGTVGTRQAFVFNLDREKWQDQRVRQAVELMFNFEWSNRTLFYGLYQRPDSFWPNTDLAATGTPTEGELAILEPLVEEGLLDESILTAEAVIPPVHDAEQNAPSRSQLREANALLQEAGWEIGDSGFYEKDGEVLEAVILQFSPQFDRIVNPFIENLNALGIRGELERVDASTYQERRLSGDFDLANAGFGMTLEPGTELEQWFASSTADESSRNLQRLRNEAVDRLLPIVTASETVDELQNSVRALDRVLRSLHFDVPQWYNAEHWVAYYDMFRHPEELPPYARGELDFWWYDAEAAEELRAAGAFQ
ncbi:ABC peptide transporter, substrate binding protein [Oceanicola granulosus HTCC2516]|uniref:ABC peptide transporter, substrate binding protein n=1 Tax=Oceanicola granulosus (strain ATCC BAA-861 / DSM 15982 / KCTC 12143 / HTCC2516) TaxID=314256 RepID=Q2CDL9_OCEGH|nr:extracellular solute-binding protein [Oceanicola granulosus]EAR50831.1 ABC peptide transporter, substrate binding protein [Oceanicola granulosus HTCC2516]